MDLTEGIIARSAPCAGRASRGRPESGETYQEALARLDDYYGGLESVRVFYSGLPADWPGKLDAGGRPMVVSFNADPGQVAAGQHDVWLDRWFREAPRPGRREYLDVLAWISTTRWQNNAYRPVREAFADVIATSRETARL